MTESIRRKGLELQGLPRRSELSPSGAQTHPVSSKNLTPKQTNPGGATPRKAGGRLKEAGGATLGSEPPPIHSPEHLLLPPGGS